MKSIHSVAKWLLALACSLTAIASFAGAPDVLYFASITANQDDPTNKRYEDFLAYLSQKIGIPVRMKNFKDYASLIESQRTGEVHIASYGSSSFARAITTGVKTSAFATPVNNGGKGYYSVFYVKANSPYQRLQDLKGKSIALVDPDSTSGNMVPRLEMNKMGIRPEEFFGQVTYTGSHEKAVINLSQGLVDVAANAWISDTSSNMMRLSKAGVVNKDDFRIIFKSDLIPNGPFAFLDDLPDELKIKIANAFLVAQAENKTAFEKAIGAGAEALQPVRSEDYRPIIELNRFVDGLKK